MLPDDVYRSVTVVKYIIVCHCMSFDRGCPALFHTLETGSFTVAMVTGTTVPTVAILLNFDIRVLVSCWFIRIVALFFLLFFHEFWITRNIHFRIALLQMGHWCFCPMPKIHGISTAMKSAAAVSLGNVCLLSRISSCHATSLASGA